MKTIIMFVVRILTLRRRVGSNEIDFGQELHPLVIRELNAM